MIEFEVVNSLTKLASEHPYIGLILLSIGVLKLSSVCFGFLAVLRSTCIPRKSQIAEYKPRTSNETWAVVTGPTAGIGEEFAYQIASAKFNVALVSRNQAKLDIIAQEIESKYKVKTAVFVLDAATAKKEDYQSLNDFVRNLGSVTVLVNNLGISHDMPTPFAEVTDEELNRIVQVNCIGTLEITKAVLPTLEVSLKGGPNKGLILTMGSFAGLTPTPMLSVYSGSKMFLQGWSSALAEELKPANIDVQLIISYLVTSKMSKVRKTSMLVPNPKGFVKSVLRQIGMSGGARERAYTMTPYWSHAIMHWTIETALGVYSSIVSKINFNMHADIRKRALRKKNKGF